MTTKPVFGECDSNDFLEESLEDLLAVGEEATLAAFAAIINKELILQLLELSIPCDATVHNQ
jgi:hypothetical protein